MLLPHFEGKCEDSEGSKNARNPTRVHAFWAIFTIRLGKNTKGALVESSLFAIKHTLFSLQLNHQPQKATKLMDLLSGKSKWGLSKWGLKVLVHNCPRLPTIVVILRRNLAQKERGPKRPQKCTIVDDCAQIAESGLKPPLESPHLDFPDLRGHFERGCFPPWQACPDKKTSKQSIEKPTSALDAPICANPFRVTPPLLRGWRFGPLD